VDRLFAMQNQNPFVVWFFASFVEAQNFNAIMSWKTLLLKPEKFLQRKNENRRRYLAKVKNVRGNFYFQDSLVAH
jgi:hypothetical protein